MSSPSPIKLLLTFLSISAILFLSLFGLSNSLKATPKTTPLTHHSHSYSHLHVYQHLRIARSSCDGTLYPELCVSTLVSLLPTLSSKTLIHIISGTVKHTIQDIKASSLNCRNIKHRQRKQLSPLETTALDDCIELFDSSIAELRSAISDLTAKRNSSSSSSSSIRFNDVQTLFSGVMTNQYTCLDGFAFSKGHVREAIMSRVVNISRHTSNSLAMLQKIPGFNTTSFPTKKPEVFPEYGRVKRGFPTWLSSKDRKMLQTSTVDGIEYDIVVAKDGTGNFTTINEAVDAAPKESTTRFVIYIKAGAYFENVEVPRKKTMLMFLGDGIGKTVIKASRNVVDGWTTFRSATVAVVGNGFIAKGITIENAAGPSKHQAVALRSGSDFSAFYKCSFVGYQDTLYVHSLRQFYRDCDVYGTVDFVFGNAAVVLQNCNLYARKPNDNQKNMFTAQGREDPFQNTGISIMYSKIAAAADLIPNVTDFKTYLGRPWKEYSRTVILRSYIGDLVDPAGWMEWNADFALSTLYYGEYMNRGPGSNTSARVTWPGFRVLDNITEAGQFTVEPFLQGSEWLNSTGVPYSLDLI